ncbi:MAG: glycosyltransferase family 39 protein [Candidatus Aenigmarchaeota archaeon]|nr:glycosyltransferase family 39 protein [Candidatus Aenigmarchaeota archaeon]
MINKIDKRTAVIAILISILILGLGARLYHIDYPVIGYHNMKEAHTLGESYSFYNDAEFFSNKEMYSITFDNPSGAHMDNLPILSWINAGLWSVFGINLWIARLVIILLSLGAIIMSYFPVKKLFTKESIAILAAFFIAITPMLIFFGRNVQYDMPALFFMLTGLYFFLKWKEDPSHKNFILMALFITLTALVKLTFLIILLPIAALFPYHRLRINDDFKKKYIKQIGLAVVFVLIVIWFLFYSSSIAKQYNATPSIQPFEVSEFGKTFTGDFWLAVFNYAITDNYSIIWVVFSILGVLLAIVNLVKHRTDIEKFIVVYAFSYFIYALSSPAQMMGHSYYQIPFAPLVVVSMLYLFAKIFDFFSILKIRIGGSELKYLSYIIVFILIVSTTTLVYASASRQFDTQFYGLDIAGDYINKNSQANEVVFESGGQDRGVAWHSKRRLAEFTRTYNLSEQFIEMENMLNVSWVFVYQWGFNDVLGQPGIKDYVYSNYSLKQVAFVRTPQGNQPVYFLFKKGGSFDESMINELLADKPVQHRDYEYTSGTLRVEYINV